MCECLQVLASRYIWIPEENVSSTGARVTDLSHQMWFLGTVLWYSERALLTTELTLQAVPSLFLEHINLFPNTGVLSVCLESSLYPRILTSIPQVIYIQMSWT